MLGSPQDKADSLIAVRTRPGSIEDHHGVPARFGGEVLAEPVQRGLAHHIGRQHRDRREADAAGDVDDAAMAAGEHARQDRPRAVQRSAQIDLQRLPPLVGVGRRQRAHGAELDRVVDQQIDRPDRLLDRGDRVLHLLAVGDVAP